MVSESGGTIHRLVLDRILGVGTHQFTDSSGVGLTHRIHYPCGCTAREERFDHFRVEPNCERHREGLGACERHGDAR